MEKKLQVLKEKRDWYISELDDLHRYEPNEKWYRLRKFELESQIDQLQIAIYKIERELEYEAFRTRRLIGSAVLIGIISLIIYMISRL